MDFREVEMEEAEEEVSHDQEEVVPHDPEEGVPRDPEEGFPHDPEEVVPHDPEEEVPCNVVDGQEESQVDTKMESEKGDSPGQMAEEEQNLIETGMDETKSVGERSDQQNSEYESEDSGSPNQNASEEEKVSGNVEDTSPSENGQHHSELPADEPLEGVKEGLSDGPSEPVEKDAALAVAEDNSDGAVAPNEILKSEAIRTSTGKQHEPSTPVSLVKYSLTKAKTHNVETPKSAFDDIKMAEGDEIGTPEDQAAFMREIESFYRERSLEFKPPKFYGQPLNCLKLWRAVIRLGGYDRVTGSKLWRQVGESFHPPKTCTTVSWTFRIFYEKALLEYERNKVQSGEVELPIAPLPEPSSVENEPNGYQAPGSGRARRDAAARAMQGWHAQRLYGGEIGEPIIKDKNLNIMQKREKNLKSIGSLKHKRPSEVEHSVRAARIETSKQLVTTVVDIGPPADWVKINVRETKDSFEVYALVPGLLREEVRVQSDPAGRLVITGHPEQPDNPWGITAFKKVVSLPGRIDPLNTSAVVSLHGRLFVRVPFEHSNI